MPFFAVVNLGSKLAGPATNVLVPLLAGSKFGWRSVTWLYASVTAAFAVLWQLLVSETPPLPLAPAVTGAVR